MFSIAYIFAKFFLFIIGYNEDINNIFNSLSIYFIKYCCIMNFIMVVYYIGKLYSIIMFYYNKYYIIPIYYPNKIKKLLLKNSINFSSPTIGYFSEDYELKRIVPRVSLLLEEQRLLHSSSCKSKKKKKFFCKILSKINFIVCCDIYY